MMTSLSPNIHRATYIDIPTSLTKHCHGIAMDFGGSVLKVAYRPKDKVTRQGEPPVAEGRERIHLAAYSRTDLDKGLAEIAELADVRKGDSPVRILTTGVGSTGFADKLRKTFSVESKNVAEFDCFVTCFKETTKYLSKDEVLDPPDIEGEKWAQKAIESFMGMADKLSQHTDGSFEINPNEIVTAVESAQEKGDPHLPYVEANPDIYPCFLVMCGSAFGLIKINKDGSFQMVEASNRGGRSFLGLGSMLTGAKTFDELVGLAEKGDDHAVSLYTTDILDHTRDDMYALMPDDLLAFSFGKTVGKAAGDFKREDLARALVVQYVTDLAFFIHMSLGVHDISNIFMCGNFANAGVIRHELTKHLCLRKPSPFVKTKFDFHFLKFGGFLGAIGAFMKEVEPTSVRSEA